MPTHLFTPWLCMLHGHVREYCLLQVIISVDPEAYTRGLYGPGGPKYDKEFLDEGGDEESEETG